MNKIQTSNTKDKIIAKLFQCAAEEGVPISMNNYAECLKFEVGVTKDVEEAAEYFYRSYKNGYFKARKNLDMII